MRVSRYRHNFRVKRPLRDPSLTRGMGLPMKAASAILLTASLWIGVSACERSHQELTEWTPRDHDNQGAPAQGQVDTRAPRPGMPAMEKYGINDVILATWKQQCSTCHGLIGRGDGPNAMASRPRDLTDPVWQKNASDEEIAHSIQKGRGRMPPFPGLPKDTVSGLIRLIRLMNQEGPKSPPNSAATPESAPNH